VETRGAGETGEAGANGGADETRVTNRTRGTQLAARAGLARSFRARLLGLMGRRTLPPGAGLLFPGTPWVHTCFMRFPIDAVFFGRGGVVLGVTHALAPWRVSPYCRGAQGVVELPAGTARRTRTEAGDVLDFDPPL
jgi:uncharacterized protein